MNSFKTVLLLALVAILAVFASAEFERQCAFFGHGHVSAANGKQYRVARPGDYWLTVDLDDGPVLGRFTQCPGSTAGAVCMTAISVGFTEYYWNTESNTLESFNGGGTPSSVPQNIEGHEVGYTVTNGPVTITLTNNGLLVTYDFDEPSDEWPPMGLCGNYDSFKYGVVDAKVTLGDIPNIDYDTLEDFNMTSATQEDIDQFTKSWTGSNIITFQYRSFPAGKDMGDFSAWEPFTPDTSSIPETCTTIAAYNAFLGAACAYDVAATGREESRFSAHWMRSPLCKYIDDEGVHGFKGMFADYEDIAKCYFYNNVHEYLHEFNAEKRDRVDTYRGVVENFGSQTMDRAILHKDGSANRKFGVVTPGNVGGKYKYHVEYEDNCGTTTSHEATLNIRCNTPPTVDVGSDVIVTHNEDNKIVLRVKMSDADGDNLAVSWKIVDWPNRLANPADDLDEYVKNQEGFDSEYFAFDMGAKSGNITVEVAVSDYCNVVYGTVIVDMQCTRCTEKLNFGQQSEATLYFNAKDESNDLNYGQTVIGMQSNFEIDNHRITPVSDEYMAYYDNTNSHWEIRTAYTVGEESVSYADPLIDDDRDVDEDDSFLHKTYIPTLENRGVIVSEETGNNPFNQEYLRTARNVLSQRFKYTDKQTNTTTATYTASYTPRTKAYCQFDFNDSGDELSLELSRVENGNDIDLDVCSQVWEVEMNATSSCGTEDTATAIITSDCPVPQSNVYCPDEVTFDYSTRSFPEVTLNGRDSTSGATTSTTDNTEYPNGYLRYSWSYASAPENAGSLSCSPSNNANECITTLGNAAGTYTVALEVNNNCRSNTNTVDIEAKCPVGAPTNLEDITTDDEQDGVTVINATYAQPGADAENYDVTLGATLSFGSYPEDAVNALNNEIRKVDATRGISTTPSLGAVESEFNVFDITHNNILYDNDYRVAGEYTYDVSVSDGCRSNARQGVATITTECDRDAIDLDYTVDHESNPVNLMYTFNSSGWPTVEMSFEAVAADEANNNLPAEFQYLYSYRFGDSIGFNPEHEVAATIDRSYSFTGPRTLTVNAMALVPDYCRYTDAKTFTITAECPDAPVFDEGNDFNSPLMYETTSTKDNLTESFTFSAAYTNAASTEDADTPIDGEWQYYTGSQWEPVDINTPLVVEFSSNETHATLEIEETPWLEAGDYEFRLVIENADPCEKSIRTFTLTVKCPNPNFATSAFSSAATYRFDNNRFPVVEVTGSISGIDDEDITPKEFYRYSWIFTETPALSAYLKYDEREVIVNDEDDGSGYDRDEIVDDDGYITGYRYYRDHVSTTTTTKTIERSALNRDRMPEPSSYEDFDFHGISVEYEERLHGCFIPDVPGTYVLALETRFNETDFCHEDPATVSFEVECNDAPVLTLLSPTEVTKSAENPQRVQLNLQVEDTDQVSIEWSFASSQDYPGSDAPQIMDPHARQPSFLAVRAGEYTLTAAVEDGCSRVVETFTITVSCTDTLSVDPTTSSVVYDYDSTVDISQYSMAIAPEYINSRCSGARLVSAEFEQWEAPEMIPEPSSSASDSDDVDSDVSPASRAVAQPAAAFVALVVAVLALLM